jgi:hypothetical protein
MVHSHAQQQQNEPAAAPEPGSAALAAAAAAVPISQFTAWQLATFLWASAKLGLQVPTPAWPTIMDQICHVSSAMSPRDTSLTLWSLARLKPPVAVGWVVLALLENSKQPLQAYPAR